MQEVNSKPEKTSHLVEYALNSFGILLKNNHTFYFKPKILTEDDRNSLTNKFIPEGVKVSMMLYRHTVWPEHLSNIYQYSFETKNWLD